MTTIFEKILKAEMPGEIIFETEHLFAIKDIAPTAPVHLLIITKKVIPSLQALKPQELFLMGEVVQAAQHLATQFGIAEGYRLISNHGSLSGQTIPHLHFHLIGGRQLGRLG